MLTEHQLLIAQPIIRRIALGFPNAGEAEDLTQTALLHVWSKRSLFMGDDRGAEHFIARVAHRVCISAARHAVVYREAEKLGADNTRGVATPEETLLAKEALGIFAAQMQKRAANKNPTQALHRARQATAKALSL